VLIDCETVSGNHFRPLFGQSITPELFEEWMAQTYLMTANDFKRREDEGLIILDWHKDGISYSAGLQNNALIFVSLHFGPDSLNAKQVFDCLGGAPQSYQAWYDSYPELNASSIQAAFIYPEQRLIAYGSIYMQSAAPEPPELKDSLPIVMVNLFGQNGEEKEKTLSQSQPWPGNWKALEIRSIKHQ
jgi:hypothetical protein